jgi:hypothetical protein
MVSIPGMHGQGLLVTLSIDSHIDRVKLRSSDTIKP